MFECHSRTKDYETGDLGPIVLESRRTYQRDAAQDSQLLRMFGKRCEVVEVK